ncbi:MAG: hypothetical protein U5L72_16275 [Bacteroidales bacterium]|nr:hypothetical protein [Bacteroidales bacterium]
MTTTPTLPPNPLLQEWNTPFSIAPFEQISPEHFKPAVEHAIEVARREVDEIVACKAEAAFGNTIEALEHAGALLNRITPVLFNLNSSDTTPELQAAARDISPLLTSFANDISLNPELFRKVRTVYDKRESLNLNPEQQDSAPPASTKDSSEAVRPSPMRIRKSSGQSPLSYRPSPCNSKRTCWPRQMISPFTSPLRRV